MPIQAPIRSVFLRAYVLALAAAGCALVAFAVSNWQPANLPYFFFLVGLAAIGSRMKVTLSEGAGTMSMNFLFILIGIHSLSLGEALAIGCIGIVIQRFLRANNAPTATQVLFNVGSVLCCIGLAHGVSEAVAGSAQWLDESIRLLLAATTFFVANTWSVSLAIALSDSKRAWDVWRDTYMWSFPNYLVGAAVTWVVGAISNSFGWQASLLVLPVVYVIYRSHRQYVERLEAETRRAEEQKTHADEVTALHRRTLETLALAAEAKDQNTAAHLARVEVYALEIGRELGLDAQELKALEAAALLHDIGKLAVPDYIVTKPGKLTAEEFNAMKIHPVVGAELVDQVGFPYDVASIVRAHHERWDGGGYPDGLAERQIPIGGRILAAVDCLDALATDRPYRRAMPLAQALEVVRNDSGRAFDPQVVEALSRRCVELESLARKRILGKQVKLSIDIKVERGVAPAAGLETSAPPANVDSTSTDLISMSRRVQGQPEFDDLCQSLATAIPFDLLVIYKRHQDLLIPEFLHGENREQFASLRIPLGAGLAGWIAQNHKPILNGNPSVEPGLTIDPARFPMLASALAVPLESQGSPIGVLSLYRREPDSFNKTELTRLVELARTLTPLIVKDSSALS